MKKLSLILSLFFLPLLTLGADKVFVQSAITADSLEPDVIAVEELVKSAVPQSGNYIVVPSEEDSDFTLSTRLIKLGSAYILKIDKVQDRNIIYSDKMKASRIEEMDRIATRLTRSVINEKPVAEDARVGDVTEQESTQGTLRKPTVSGSSFGFGPAVLSSLGTNGVGVYLRTSHSWDVNSAIIELGGDLAAREGAFFLSGNLGGKFFLSQTGVAPFIGGDFGYGLAKATSSGLFDGDWENGFTLGATAGIHFLRTSSINLELALRALFMLNSNEIGNPAMYALRLSLYF